MCLESKTTFHCVIQRRRTERGSKRKRQIQEKSAYLFMLFHSWCHWMSHWLSFSLMDVQRIGWSWTDHPWTPLLHLLECDVHSGLLLSLHPVQSLQRCLREKRSNRSSVFPRSKKGTLRPLPSPGLGLLIKMPWMRRWREWWHKRRDNKRKTRKEKVRQTDQSKERVSIHKMISSLFFLLLFPLLLRLLHLEKLTLFLQDFVLFPQVFDVLLMRGILPPHALNVLGCLLQDLGSRGLRGDIRRNHRESRGKKERILVSICLTTQDRIHRLVPSLHEGMGWNPWDWRSCPLCGLFVFAPKHYDGLSCQPVHRTEEAKHWISQYLHHPLHVQAWKMYTYITVDVSFIITHNGFSWNQSSCHSWPTNTVHTQRREGRGRRDEESSLCFDCSVKIDVPSLLLPEFWACFLFLSLFLCLLLSTLASLKPSLKPLLLLSPRGQSKTHSIPWNTLIQQQNLFFANQENEAKTSHRDFGTERKSAEMTEQDFCTASFYRNHAWCITKLIRREGQCPLFLLQ